jgi:hypothetical protein
MAALLLLWTIAEEVHSAHFCDPALLTSCRLEEGSFWWQELWSIFHSLLFGGGRRGIFYLRSWILTVLASKTVALPSQQQKQDQKAKSSCTLTAWLTSVDQNPLAASKSPHDPFSRRFKDALLGNSTQNSSRYRL